MSATGALASLRHRSYRFQWMADLSTSWAFEMETIMLSWFILVETQSVFLLTLFASTQYIGTLFSPVYGVMGHRVGNKRVYCSMRACYTLLAALMLALVFTGSLTPLYVFVIATLQGLVRPSDLVLRYALIGETMAGGQLMAATSVSRTTQDSARVIGALAGAGIVATLGMAMAYAAVVSLYAISLALSFQVASVRYVTPAGAIVGQDPPASISLWRDLRDGAVHVWHMPQLLAAMSLACLVNLTAFPLTHGLLPHVAKDIYHTDQTGLGYLSAAFSFGALMGSIFLSRFGPTLPLARMMILFCGAWYCMALLFAHMPGLASGIVALLLTGCAQSLGMVPMSAMLLRNAGPRFRGHVMGIRMLMIYSLPVGLVIAGPLITHYGFRTMANLYCAIGLVATVCIALRWREHIWRLDAPANKL